MQVEKYQGLINAIEGEVYTSSLYKKLYATDASVYRALPEAVIFPKHEQDIQQVITFAKQHKIGIVPRAAGTSLAGQCVGKGIILDVSKHMTGILELDENAKTVRVQPGVIRDELNMFLEPYGLFFGPNTSTSNRCMIGGMLGNNSSGTTSIQYGVTRDKVIAMRTVLSSGEVIHFSEEDLDGIKTKITQPTQEGKIYKFIHEKLQQQSIRENLFKEFPDSSIHRRNTGYALDVLASSRVYDSKSNHSFNIAKLLAGSEGTLGIITEVTLRLDKTPPKKMGLVVPQYDNYSSCLSDVAVAMQHNLFTCEMLDKPILDRTAANAFYKTHRFFIKDDPQAILMLEVRADTEEELKEQMKSVESSLKVSGQSSYVASLYGTDVTKALDLRKAGLGLLGNIVGDTKAVACVEDTAVSLDVLSEFISEFREIMESFGQKGVYYAHAGAGELHIRPMLNLKKTEDIEDFKSITESIARLTKKYRGSFSGEHGDGIVRSSFLPLMIGEDNYQLLKDLKHTFDPEGIFNPGKIIDAWPMDVNLRYEADREEPKISTKMDFTDNQGILRLSENCNGSGDCRKTHLSNGAMCPSYQATKDELHTTRGRANVLREVLTNNKAKNKFDSEELKEAMSLCLSCKACQSECPSNVDIATAKTEFLYQYSKEHGTNLSQRLFAYNIRMMRMASIFPSVSNWMFENDLTSKWIKSIGKIAAKRSLPKIIKPNFKKIAPFKVHQKTEVILFVDEFCNYMDGKVAEDATILLRKLGYRVTILRGLDSGRSYLSKGFLDQAEKEIHLNLQKIAPLLNENTVLVGIEPSAILSFKDEYLRLAKDKELARKIADKTYIIDAFLASEIRNKNILSDSFTDEVKEVKIHVHCHHKAIGNQKDTFDILNLPLGYQPTILPTGCCGMAGSFGYEEDKYDLSIKIAELHLAPSVRKAKKDVLIAANGISCRQQIKHTTDRQAKHPVSILKDALR